ncbi:MAG: CDP-alcohol phosphatidyltransferase family protein [Thermoleophilia bacterium]
MSGQIARHPLHWLPNALTLARIAALPVLAWLILRQDGPTAPAAGWVFGGVAVTDFIDGRLARAWHAESTFGRLADPFADRLLVAMGLIGLITLHRMHPAGPVIVLARDALTVGAVVLLRNSGLDVRVDLLGKVSSATVMLGTGLALLSDARWIDVVFWLGVALSVAALANYVRTVIRVRAGSTRA